MLHALEPNRQAWIPVPHLLTRQAMSFLTPQFRNL